VEYHVVSVLIVVIVPSLILLLFRNLLFSSTWVVFKDSSDLLGRVSIKELLSQLRLEVTRPHIIIFLVGFPWTRWSADYICTSLILTTFEVVELGL
jgi:hypothetical protein